MRKLYVLLMALCLGFLCNAQTVSIGTGTSTTGQSPWDSYYGYSYVQTIYLGSEINATGNITSIQYYYAGTSLTSNQAIKVYMANVTKSSFASTTDWVPLASLSLVFDGNVGTPTVPGWITINLATPFAFNGTGNLVVAIDENTSGDDGSIRFRGTTIGTNRVLYYRSDGTNPDPAAPPTGTRSSVVGNIQIQGLTLQGCQPATGVAVSNITTTAASASWTAPAGGSSVAQYNWEVRTSGAAGSGSTGLSASGNSASPSVSLTSLNAGTSYSFYVRSDCGGGSYSSWNSAAVFTTSCTPIVTLPWSENFDALTTLGSGILPACWSHTAGSNSFTSSNAASNSYNDPNSAPNYITIYYPTTAAYLWTPGFQLTSGTSYDFTFKWAGDSYSGWVGDAFVNSAQNPTGAASLGASFVTSATTTTSTYKTQTYTFIPSSSGVYYFGVKAMAATSAPFYMGFDDFKVDLTPSCVAPVLTTTTSLSSNAATVNWNAAAPAPASYDLYYSTTNTAPTGSTTPTISGIAGTSQAISGLTAATTYYAWVRSNCGSGSVSSWSGTPTSFTTSCVAINIPYTENFDGVTTPNLPSCTSKQDVNNDGTTWATTIAPTGYTGKTLAYGYNSTNAANDWFYTPGINLTAGTSYTLTFKYGNNSSTFSEKMKVYYGTAASASSMTNLLQDFPAITNSTVNSGSIMFTPSSTGVYYIGFNAYSAADQYNLYVDDLSLDVSPTTPCAAPADQATGLTFGTQGTTSQAGSFTAAASGPSGYLVVRSVGALTTNPVDGTTYAIGSILGNGVVVQSSAALTFTATGLTGNTDYTFTVIDYNNTACLGGPVYNTHALTGDAITCTTTPASLTFPFKTVSQLQVSWTSSKGGNAVSPLDYIIDVSTENTFTTGVIPGSPFSVTDTTTIQSAMSYTVSGLNPTTTYYFRIKLASGCNTTYSSIANISTSAFDQDDASGAVILTHTNYSATCLGTAYTTSGATTSGEPSNCFSSSQDDDIWFKFVATDTKAILKVSNYTSASGTAGTFYYGIYTGNPGTLTELDCELSSVISTTNSGGEIYIRKPLVVGQTYYIRALTGGSSGRANFNLCVTTPDVSATTTANTCVTAPTITINSTSGNTSVWVPIYTSDGKLLAEINGNGNTLGTVTAKVYRNTNAVRTDLSGKPYLDRNIEITPTTQPASGTVSVRVYFTASEFAALKATANSQVNSTTDLGVFKNNQLCGAVVTVVANPLSTSAVSYESNYYVSFNVPSFSSFFIASNTFAVLPANILTFSGLRQGAANNLKWTVAQETDVQTYGVERSEDGNRWSTVGTVSSLGNTTQQRTYSFTDNNISGIKQLYRLRQTDRNGSAKISNTIVINGTKATLLTLSGLFPNPASGKVNLLVDAPAKDNITIVVMDAVGRVVKTQKAAVDAGSNTLEVNVASLAGGSYMIKLTCDSNCQSAVSKFVKE